MTGCAQRFGLVLATLASGSLISVGAASQNAGQADTMEFGVITHFSQGWPRDLISSADWIGAGSIRDSVPWETVETSSGAYAFDDPLAAFPEWVGDTLPLSITFNHTNGLYDGGNTPHTDAGRGAAARFMVATLDRFPNIDRIEVGNEFNAQNFVSGPVRDAPYAERAGFYVDLLRTMQEAVGSQHPDVTILGGAAHSIPVGYYQQLFELGALSLMDGIVIHPYTSEPEHVGEHIGILNAAMGADRVPIYATEVGQEVSTAAEAADYLVQMVVALAAADIASAQWYALREQRFFQNMGLLDEDASVRPAGRAFQEMQGLLQSAGNPSDVSPDAMTYAYRFGDEALVLWGEPRTVTLASGVTAHDAAGTPLTDQEISLDPDRPLILRGGTLAFGDSVVLGPQRLIGDSFHQFDWTNDPDSVDGFEGPWSYFALSGTGDMTALYTQGGGTVQAEPWTPYLGQRGRRPLLVDARQVNPVDFANGEDPAQRYAVVERFTADQAKSVDIEGRWRLVRDSEDGITLRITVDGREVFSGQSRDEIVVDLPGVALQAGSTIDFEVGSNQNARGGDLTDRRIRILESAS